jgi:hypothetical protein
MHTLSAYRRPAIAASPFRHEAGDGPQLDLIVERYRRLTARDVFDCLRPESAKTWGDEPEPWLQRLAR